MKKIFLPFMAILLFASCHKENERISVCHTDPKTGTSKVINISLNEWPAHQAHGDVRLDDQDGDGYVPNNACGFGKIHRLLRRGIQSDLVCLDHLGCPFPEPPLESGFCENAGHEAALRTRSRWRSNPGPILLQERKFHH